MQSSDQSHSDQLAIEGMVDVVPSPPHELTALEVLYRSFATQLHGFIKANWPKALSSRVDPEDLVQSVFRRFCKARERGLYQCPNADEIWKLLAVMALNRLRSEQAFQQAAKRDIRHTTKLDHLITAPKSELDGPISSLLRLTIQDAIERLPAHFQKAIQLRMQDHQVDSIAEIMGRSKRTIERILNDSYRLLRLSLKDCHAHAN